MKHFVYVPFTGLGLQDGFRGQEWYDYRVKIFEEFTLKSLVNQSCKDFILWISFRPNEKENPTTKKLEESLKESGLKFILTFDGVMMYDDRGVEHNEDLVERMQRSLGVIKDKEGSDKWVYVTGLGSDDMLEQDAIKEIQEQKPKMRGATYYLNGYIINTRSKQLARWVRSTSCSKYTIMYPGEIFYDAKKHMEYETNKSHEDIPQEYDATLLQDGRYACTVHGANISTGWNNSFRGEEIFGEDKNEIFERFGIEIHR